MAPSERAKDQSSKKNIAARMNNPSAEGKIAILDAWSKRIARLLTAASDVPSSVATHGGIVGDAREVLVRDVLERLLPRSLVVGTGQIQDIAGNKSLQIDIVVYRADFPILRTLGHSDVFLLEGVVAAIEVKSELDSTTLIEGLENCASVRRLYLNCETSSLNTFVREKTNKDFGDLDELEKNFVLEHLLPTCYIFGYRGYKSRISDLADAMRTWLKTQKPILWLPEVVATEGIVVLKNLGRPHVCKTADAREWAVVGAMDDAPLRYLLSQLLFQVLEATGRPAHAGSRVRFSLDAYFGPSDVNTKEWTGIFGEVKRRFP